jgi:hypothetical protein
LQEEGGAAYLYLVSVHNFGILEKLLCLFPWPFLRYSNAARTLTLTLLLFLWGIFILLNIRCRWSRFCFYFIV